MTLEALAVAVAADTAEEASEEEAEAAEAAVEVVAVEEATLEAAMIAIAVVVAVIITVEAVEVAVVTVVMAEATKTVIATQLEVETITGALAIRHGELILDMITREVHTKKNLVEEPGVHVEVYKRPQTVGLAHTQPPNLIPTKTTARPTAVIVEVKDLKVVMVVAETIHTSHPVLIPTRKLPQFTW